MAKTGWGTIRVGGDRPELLDCGVIGTDAATPHVERLWHIGGQLRARALASEPQLICVERVFVNVNAKTSLLLGEARGAALMALSAASAPIIEITALQIKQSLTGLGRASKAQVAQMVARLLGISRPLPTDCSDALACALAGHGNLARQAGFKRRRGIPSRRQLAKRR